MSGSAHMAMGVFIGAMVVYVARPKVVESAVKYSLQGTTQGNGLTGGAPPVRFSM